MLSEPDNSALGFPGKLPASAAAKNCVVSYASSRGTVQQAIAAEWHDLGGDRLHVAGLCATVDYHYAMPHASTQDVRSSPGTCHLARR